MFSMFSMFSPGEAPGEPRETVRHPLAILGAWSNGRRGGGKLPPPDGTLPSVMVTIDRAGRVVIPQEVRNRLALGANSELEIDVEGDVIRLTPIRPRTRSVVKVGSLLVLAPTPGTAVTDADVQRWRDADQR